MLAVLHTWIMQWASCPHHDATPCGLCTVRTIALMMHSRGRARAGASARLGRAMVRLVGPTGPPHGRWSTRCSSGRPRRDGRPAAVAPPGQRGGSRGGCGLDKRPVLPFGVSASYCWHGGGVHTRRGQVSPPLLTSRWLAIRAPVLGTPVRACCACGHSCLPAGRASRPAGVARQGTRHSLISTAPSSSP